MAIRANPGATEWRAITGAFHEEGGKLRVGAPCLDFGDETLDAKAVELALEKPAAFKFEIDEQNRVAFSGAGKIKFSRSYAGSEVASSGVAGIFVKSGKVFVCFPRRLSRVRRDLNATETARPPPFHSGVTRRHVRR